MLLKVFVYNNVCNYLAGLGMPNGDRGIHKAFSIKFENIGNPTIWLDALGQVRSKY